MEERPSPDVSGVFFGKSFSEYSADAAPGKSDAYLDWVTPTGKYKTASCRQFLEKLEGEDLSKETRFTITGA
jgi:hypothetical protein